MQPWIISHSTSLTVGDGARLDAVADHRMVIVDQIAHGEEGSLSAQLHLFLGHDDASAVRVADALIEVFTKARQHAINRVATGVLSDQPEPAAPAELGS